MRIHYLLTFPREKRRQEELRCGPAFDKDGDTKQEVRHLAWSFVTSQPNHIRCVRDIRGHTVLSLGVAQHEYFKWVGLDLGRHQSCCSGNHVHANDLLCRINAEAVDMVQCRIFNFHRSANLGMFLEQPRNTNTFAPHFPKEIPFKNAVFSFHHAM
jgi:hypothetical protein